MFKKINLRRELEKQRISRPFGEDNKVLFEAYELLYREVCAEKDILERMKAGEDTIVTPPPRTINFNRIFTESDIRKLAIRQRLRFLKLSQFKQDVPTTAIADLKELERKTGVQFGSFKILAPSEAFILPHCEEDPLLFVQIGFRTWYLVAEWGNDLAWYRNLLFLPIRNKFSMGLTIVLLASLIAVLFPYGWIVNEEWAEVESSTMALFSWIFICAGAFLTYLRYALFGELSSEQWENPFLKDQL